MIDLKELQEKRIYTYVSQHYWELTKEELATICKEIAYSSRFEDEVIYKLRIEPRAIENIKEELEEEF